MDSLYFNERNMYIDWQLSDVCNFKCSYCNFTSMGGIHGWPTIEQASGLVDNIIAFSDHEYRTYNLLGGEPTLWKHFGELCTYIKEHDNNSTVQVLTNGSRTLRWWEKYTSYMNKVIISHHSNTASKEHTYKVTKVCQPYNSVSIQMLMDVDNFAQCAEHFDYLIDKLPGVKISPKKGETELGSGEWMGYSQEQNDWINNALVRSKQNNKLKPDIERLKDHKPAHSRIFYAMSNGESWETSNKNLILNNENHFKGWECNIGIDMLCVRSDGTLKPSSACFNEINLGNYKQNSIIKWPKSPIRCIYNSCFCGADIEIEKHAPK